MKPPFVALVLGVVLVGGAGLWWYQSRSTTETASSAKPSASEAGSNASADGVRLEAQPEEQRSAVVAPLQPAPALAAAPAPSASETPKELPALSSEVDTAVPSEAPRAADADEFEAKWADAKLPDLKAAYQAYSELYQMNVEGRVTDKSQMLTGEGLERLAREIAWLKEKAFGGG